MSEQFKDIGGEGGGGGGQGHSLCHNVGNTSTPRFLHMHLLQVKWL